MTEPAPIHVHPIPRPALRLVPDDPGRRVGRRRVPRWLTVSLVAAAYGVAYSLAWFLVQALR